MADDIYLPVYRRLVQKHEHLTVIPLFELMEFFRDTVTTGGSYEMLTC